jgi:hypothetical protein
MKLERIASRPQIQAVNATAELKTLQKRLKKQTASAGRRL